MKALSEAPCGRRGRAVLASDRPLTIIDVFQQQQSLLADDAYEKSLGASEQISEQEYGAVFTRRWVAELVLDLAGFTCDRDLLKLRVIEPACGDGAFLGPIVDRLIEAQRRHGGDLCNATEVVRAYDLQPAHVAKARALIARRLSVAGLDASDARRLAESWVRHDDFLLRAPEHGTADFVLGNPPYLRLEAVSDLLSSAYRRACPTMVGRSDVFVGFFEAGVKALAPGGSLGFICADRWMRNQYGQRLRALIAAHFSVVATIEMHDVDAFEADVSAYPSITVIRRAPQSAALMATTTRTFGEESAPRIRRWASGRTCGAIRDRDFNAAVVSGWFTTGASWPSGSPERLALLADLERRFPALEDDATSTRVGIGVATGADRVFVVKNASMVEADRALPLAMARDTPAGSVEWSGHYLIDPWDDDSGSLVRLDDYPRLRDYFKAHEGHLRSRHVASRRPEQWYRTIDRVDHALTCRAKLLFPDMKATIHPVLDDGQYYPHHNLYWVTSGQWDPATLGGLLLSRIAQLFIECYAVKMRGGTLRFQAQYLRRIRVPRLDALPSRLAAELVEAFYDRDVEKATAAALRAYGIAEVPT